MRQMLIPVVVLLCLMSFVTNTEASSSDNATVVNAFQRLSALHSFREITTINCGLGEMIFHREWLKTPALLRETLFWSHAGTGVVIRTPDACYQQNDPLPLWTMRKSTSSEKKLFKKGLDYKRDLDLDKCEFTYQGIIDLDGVPSRVYSFQGMTAKAKAIRGRVWIGSADGLPRRYDFDASEVGPYEILFDNFNGPVSTELPVVEEPGSPHP